MKQRFAWQVMLCMVTGLFGLAQLGAQDTTSESVVLKAKEVSGKTGRPILAIAGSNT